MHLADLRCWRIWKLRLADLLCWKLWVLRLATARVTSNDRDEKQNVRQLYEQRPEQHRGPGIVVLLYTHFGERYTAAGCRASVAEPAAGSPHHRTSKSRKRP